jgi:DNA-binding transcriptional regulator YiaG
MTRTAKAGGFTYPLFKTLNTGVETVRKWEARGKAHDDLKLL